MTNDFSTESAIVRKAETAVLVVESKSFVAFDDWMSTALDELVARWAHAAAPNAGRSALLQPRQRRQSK